MLLSSRLPQRPFSLPARSAALTGGARVEVCIMGGGLAELIAAYYLAREKRSVMLMHSGPVGGGQASAELAHLASVLPEPYDELERLHGGDNAKLAAQSHAAAIDALEAIVRRERIACEFERLDGYRFCGGPHPLIAAEREVEASRRAGAAGTQAAPAPIERAGAQPAVRYPGQVHFHPLKLLEGLARAIAREGGRVHGGVVVRGLETGRPSIVVTSAGHRVEAGFVVMAGEPVMQRSPAHGIGLRVPRGSMSRALYWSVGERLRCARLRSASSGELLLVAGNDEPEGLEAWARTHFAAAGDVTQRFQGDMPSSPEVFAMTGLDAGGADRVYVSTASWGSAVTRAVVAGMAIRDFVVGARLPEIESAAPSGHLVFDRDFS